MNEAEHVNRMYIIPTTCTVHGQGGAIIVCFHCITHYKRTLRAYMCNVLSQYFLFIRRIGKVGEKRLRIIKMFCASLK